MTCARTWHSVTPSSDVRTPEAIFGALLRRWIWLQPSLHAEPVRRGDSRTRHLTILSLLSFIFWKDRDRKELWRLLYNSTLQRRDNEMENPNGQNEYTRARSLTAWWQTAHEMIIPWQMRSVSEVIRQKGISGVTMGTFTPQPNGISLGLGSGQPSRLAGASSFCFAAPGRFTQRWNSVLKLSALL